MIGGYPAFSPHLAEANKGFKAGYFEELAELEDKNFWFRSRNALILHVLRRYFPKAKSFFEIGCGTGFVLSAIEKIPHILLFGSDIYSVGLSFTARRIQKADLFQMDARFMPFEDEFDVIGAFDVLEHIDEDTVVLTQMYKSLTCGGGIILTVPQHPFLWSKIDEHACHVRRYTIPDLRLKVENAGFRVVRMTSFVSLPFPLLFISRCMKQRNDRHYDVMAELRINKTMNTLLEKMLAVERLVIQSGINFPFGGSLLLIARKA